MARITGKSRKSFIQSDAVDLSAWKKAEKQMSMTLISVLEYFISIYPNSSKHSGKFSTINTCAMIWQEEVQKKSMCYYVIPHLQESLDIC